MPAPASRRGSARPGPHLAAEVPVALPRPAVPPATRIARRIAFALGLLVFVALVAYLDRDGYVDADGGELSLLDAFYYSTVSVTTTGYGDIRPETPEARLVSTLLVTPARVLFLIVLVGTTLEVLAERTRETYRRARWRKSLRDHVIICGFGTKGRSAVETLLGRGRSPDDVVVIDARTEARERAAEERLATVSGSAERAEVLQAAGIDTASDLVVAVDRDDTAVLVTLTARELNPELTIVAAVREEGNAHLLRQSGANSVIVSSGAAGRLMGFACQSPQVVEALEDLLSVGQGLDIVEREVRAEEVGPLAAVSSTNPTVGVVRDERLLRFDDPEAAQLRAGDRLVQLHSNR